MPTIYVVLGEKLLPHNTPTDILVNRLETCLEVYQEGDCVIVCGGNVCARPDCTHTEAYVMRQYLEERGVPRSQIILENRSWDTISNIRYLGRICHRYHIKNLCIITSDWHLPRVKYICTLFLPRSVQVLYRSSQDGHRTERIGKEKKYLQSLYKNTYGIT